MSDNKRTVSIGRIVDIRDNIISVSGLKGSFVGELVRFKNSTAGDILGFILNLENFVCKIPLISGEQRSLNVGDMVYRTNLLVNTRCGFGVLGQVMGPLGNFLIASERAVKTELLDKIFKTRWESVETNAPGIIDRAPVTVPFMTGIVAIDCFIPIGCGQRELIIGDHNTGKTSLAITAIINQGYRNTIQCGDWEYFAWSDYKISFFLPCIYVSVGGKRSEIVRLRQVLLRRNALNYTCIVFTSADDLAALQFLAPFAGCTVGEWFMTNGYDAVVVYDDLSQHATAYRQMALLLRRPPGREAFPGDIFYLHARLLERAAQLATGGSLTALPIVQTLGGDISGYISTNIISITDGQIFLVKTLFNKGIKPAIDLTLSVSRVGSAAQYPVMSFVSRRARGILSMYRQFSNMAKVGSDDKDVMLHVNRGERLIEFLKQDLYETCPLFRQVIGLYALSLESMDNILPRNVKIFFNALSVPSFVALMSSTNKRLALLFDRSELLEPLLIIFSIDIIKDVLTGLITEFSSFFAKTFQNIQDAEIRAIMNALILDDEHVARVAADYESARLAIINTYVNQ
jgi:F-type H+-transporting ATPase subunit alpha